MRREIARELNHNSNELYKIDQEAVTADEKETDTLLFPKEFVLYLRAYTFSGFDRSSPQNNGGSRNVVSHGVVGDESYTQVRALQALLTLDQLLFYL